MSIKGTAISNGVGVGKIYMMEYQCLQVMCVKNADIEHERKRYKAAKKQAMEELSSLYNKTLNTIGEEEAQIFAAHMEILRDVEYDNAVAQVMSENKVNAEYAVKEAGDRFAQVFDAMEDEYLKARSVDVRDISDRIIHKMTEDTEEALSFDEPVILMAKELTPSEMMRLDRRMVKGIVTELGSKSSHVAILARSMGIPVIVGIEIMEEWSDKRCAVDGYSGDIYIEPDSELVDSLRSKQIVMQVEHKETSKQLRDEYVGKETRTSDGRKIKLYANIGSETDVESAIHNDAEGIGLFRTEFIYLHRDDYPTEEEQFNIYKSVVEQMVDKKVVLRTADLGADKQAAYMKLKEEDNPALGYRGMRVSLDHKEIFKTQLRAMLRAAAYGNVAVMFPMIISVDEVRQAKEVIKEAQVELAQEGLDYGSVEMGIMIETPAAVMISDKLAGEVDFFSIGTNDLTQYTLAVDRQNPRLDKFYDKYHDAILTMIKMVAKNAHNHNIWVGICGELAADNRLTQTFIEMGIDELSMEPSLILNMRKRIREV